MATLMTQSITRAGVAETYVSAAGGGDKFTPSSDTFLYVKNGGGGSINVTVVTPNTLIANVDVTDLVVAVGAGVNKMIGPFPPEHFASATDGLADITYSGVTTVTIAVLKVSKP